MTFLREESDEVDESESGLQPEGGDNRCKGIIINAKKNGWVGKGHRRKPVKYILLICEPI